MKTKLKIFFSIIFLSFFCQVFAQGDSDYVEREVIVQLLPGTNPVDFVKKIQSTQKNLANIRIKYRFGFKPSAFVLSLEECRCSPEEVLSYLPAQQEVVTATPNTKVELRGLFPGDELYPHQWNMDKIHAPEAWDLTTGGHTGDGKEIVIAIIDGGFEINHPDLINNLWVNKEEIPGNGIDDDGNGFVDDMHGWNFKWDSPVFNEHYHGTCVAGIIGGEGDNEIGVAGVNWSIKMMYFSVLGYADIVAALDYILQMRKTYNQTEGERGAFVVATNASIGFPAPCTQYPLWAELMDSLGNEGVLSVGATVNSNVDVDAVGDTPTSCPGDYLISVANSDRYDRRVKNSGYGKKTIDLAAPGGEGSEGVFSTTLNDDYTHSFTSNSAAAPHVTGAVGLLYSVGCEKFDALVTQAPEQAALLVKEAIMEGAAPLDAFTGLSVTGGRLDIYGSANYLIDWCHRSDEDDAGKITAFNLHPVPTGEILTFELAVPTSVPYKIKIFNTLGQLVFTQKVEVSGTIVEKHQIDVSSFSQGTYFITVQYDSGELFAKKFVVSRD